MKFRFGCCCEPIITSTGLWDWYRDYDAGDISPSTRDTPYVPRVASIYYVIQDEQIGEPIPDFDSHPEWAVEITGTDSSNFQNKSVDFSISPLGDTSNEIVYIHVSDFVTPRTATIKINAVTTGVEWIQMDTEWSDPDNPMPAVSIAAKNPFNRPGVAGELIDEPGIFALHLNESAGNAASSNGLVNWDVYNGGNSVRKWTISPAGTANYEQYDFYQDWLDANGGQQHEFPEYTYFLWSIAGEPLLYSPSFDDDVLIKHGFNEYHFPVGHSPQGDFAIGIRYAHIDGLPDELINDGTHTYGEHHGETFLPQSSVKIGPLQIDGDGFPFVGGETIWNFSEPVDYVIGDFGSYPLGGMWVAFTRVDGFDAGQIMGQTKSIALITFYYNESYVEREEDGLFYPDVQVEKTDLMINGIFVEQFLVFRVVNLFNNFLDPNAGFLFSPADNRDFYPQWINPRTLQKTEALQGGGHRHVVFQRLPENETIANEEWAGDRNRPGGYRLKCYLGTTLDWSLDSNWQRNGQSTGDVTFDTDNNAVVNMRAIGGGQADGDVSNGTFTINVVNREIEDAVYDGETNTLTVYIDIAGGNDTIEDLRDVIDDGGDFKTLTSANDSDVIVDGTTAVGTLSGGDDAAYAFVSQPQVHDSSDRYMYVYNFRLRVKELFGNRWKCFFSFAGSDAYPERWMITHDGEIINPAGAGIDRFGRTNSSEPAIIGALSYGCIKNSELIPLCPGYTKM